jgi:hypothetical protein
VLHSGGADHLVSIGTPPQPVSVALDTGSSDTWVDPTCSTSGPQSSIDLCNSFPVYNPTDSSTAIDIGLSMSLAYGLGTAEGEYFTDNFLVGGGWRRFTSISRCQRTNAMQGLRLPPSGSELQAQLLIFLMD